MTKRPLPASGGSWLRDDTGALEPADKARETQAPAKKADAKTGRKAPVKEA